MPRPSNSSRRTSKGTTYKRRKTKQTKKELGLIYEVIVIGFVALAVFLIISLYFNAGGMVGKSLSQFFFGVFGVGAFLMPLFVLGASVLKVFNKKNQRLNNKLILLFFLIMSISTFAQVIYIEKAQLFREIMNKKTFFPTMINYYSISSKSHVGGGFVGGLMGELFTMALGRMGSLLILSLIILSLVILITEQSFFNIVKKIGTSVHSGTQRMVQASSDAIEERNRIRQEAPVKIREPKVKQEKQVSFEEQIDKRETIDKEREERARESFFNKVMLKDGEGMEDVHSDEEEVEVAPQEKESEEHHVVLAEPEQISLIPKEEPIVPVKVTPNPEVKVEAKPVQPVKKEAKETLNKTMYEYPPLQLLKQNVVVGVKGSKETLRKNADKLEQTLDSFGVKASVVNISCGPSVTRYELQPDVGVKVSKIVNLSDDIALNLAASGIRIEAPIPGKSLIGIEVPNKEVSSVLIRDVIDTPDFQKYPSKIAFAVGKDISGETIIADIARMPHLLISGSTGSGKSVCINTLIASILFKANPNEVKLLMIDPKVVELKIYDGIPHLLIPVVTDTKKAAGALYWAVQEMSERYQMFANANVRDINGFNKLVEETGELKKMPQIVIIVDELADLMMESPKDVEEAICRLAQMARAAGIHLVLATQRPSVDVITGVIKANIPSRIAFKVTSGIDSRTIIDTYGAEKLVGKGDMLYFPSGLPKPMRVQGAFISDKEVESLVNFLKASQKANYNTEILEQISKDPRASAGKDAEDNEDGGGYDEKFEEALMMVVEMQKASASMIQRRFRVGYNRAARMIDQLHEAGFIGPDEGSKPRKVNITMEEYYQYKHNSSTSHEVSATEEDDE